MILLLQRRHVVVVTTILSPVTSSICHSYTDCHSIKYMLYKRQDLKKIKCRLFETNQV